MIINKAYKTELKPTKAQVEGFFQCAGVARFAFNWALAMRRDEYKVFNPLFAAANMVFGKKYGKAQIRGKTSSRFDQGKQLTTLKRSTHNWLYDVPSTVPELAIRDVDDAFKNFFRRCKEGAEEKGYPKFKKKDGKKSFRVRCGIEISDNTIRLPRIGVVKLKERGYIPTKGVKILSATISERIGRWYVSVTVEEEIEQQENNKVVCGVDVGIKNLLTVSDGTVFENPKALITHERKLRRLQRELSRRVKGSSNWYKTKHRIAKLHKKISDIRAHATHNATTKITKNYGRIGVEDLNVRGMVKNHHLAKSISDANFGEIHRQLEYKAEWNNGEIVKADRFYPSSKTCSKCGEIKNDLSLSERVFRCPSCGFEADRDLNAAINLEAVAQKFGETLNACGKEEVSAQVGGAS